MNPFKVAQLDSSMIDDELARSVKQLVTEKMLPDKFNDSIVDIACSAITLGPILASGYSYGCKLQNLIPKTPSESQSVPKRAIYFLLLLLYKHPKQVSDAFDGASQRTRVEVLKKLYTYLWKHWEDLTSLLTFSNLVAFLYFGQYRNIVERCLRLEMGYASRESLRNVNFEYMNHQLIWRSFTEFLLYVLPQVQLAKLKIKAIQWWRSTTGFSKSDQLVDPGTCFYCAQNNQNSKAIIPYKILPCSHMFCYYCIKSRVVNEQVFYCPICNAQLIDLVPCD